VFVTSAQLEFGSPALETVPMSGSLFAIDVGFARVAESLSFRRSPSSLWMVSEKLPLNVHNGSVLASDIHWRRGDRYARGGGIGQYISRSFTDAWSRPKSERPGVLRLRRQASI